MRLVRMMTQFLKSTIFTNFSLYNMAKILTYSRVGIIALFSQLDWIKIVDFVL